jgi:hypothetical protein
MTAAVMVLALAALGGATLVAMRLSGTLIPPTWMAIGHGLVAATGLAILAYFVFTSGGPDLVKAALGVFVLAALGGAGIFLGFHMRNRPLPIPLVLGHGLIAITGYVLLLIGYYRG